MSARFGDAPSRRFSRFFPGDAPVTWVILGANAATFLIEFVGGGALLVPLTFHTYGFLARPWTLLTYPLVASGHVLWLLIGGYMLWMFGGSLERSWGRRDYAVFLALVSAGAALMLWAGGAIFGRGTMLAGLWLPLASTITAWSVINPRERLLLYFVIPMEARWLGIVASVLVFFSFPVPFGLFALAGPGLAWWFVREGRYRLAGSVQGGGPARRTARPMTINPITLLRRWRMKRQFMRLVQSSSSSKTRDHDG